MSEHRIEKSLDLTVVIPAYNASLTISGAISSAWNAGASQVIVVDDGSNDATSELATNLGAQVVHQANAGAAQARRNGLTHVTSTFCILLDSDDELIAEGVKELVSSAIDAPEFGAVGGVTVGVGLDGFEAPFKLWIGKVTPARLIRTGYSPCPPGALVWRTDVLTQAAFGSLKPLWLRYADDYELFIRGSLLTSFLFRDTNILRYAMNGGKSAQLPINSMRASEAIRQHYAAQLGLKIRALSESQLLGRAMIRQAKAEASSPVRRKLLFGAFARDPAVFASLALARAHRMFGISTGKATR
jgi:glycosyltransferase involved in cell wall biosynthesis